MTQKLLPTRLPKQFHSLFWDIDAGKLNPGKKPYYVINRMLDKGDLKAARWVLKHFPEKTIVETFKKIRDFSPWNGTFWAKFLEIPEKEVACLHPSYLKRRKTLWPH